MTGGEIVLASASGMSGLGVIGTLVWAIVSGRRKPELDQAELQAMVDRSNVWRDTRLWQLEAYLNVVTGWQFNIVTQFRRLVMMLHRLREDGILPQDTEIPEVVPEPPPIPQPPARD